MPGPTLRGRVGDVFNLTVVNDATMPHSIDFHASQVAPNVEMATILPGKSLLYQFKADYAGIWMYHCGTTPALQHIANGMFGAVVIDPPNLAPVAHEYVMIQSELYLGPPGGRATTPRCWLPRPMPSSSTATPTSTGTHSSRSSPGSGFGSGSLIRAPTTSPRSTSSAPSSTPFKEGHYELQPGNPTGGGSQALDLAPAQGGFVELAFTQPGVYTMVSHRFADATKGDLGTFDVGGATGTMNH